MNPAETIRGRAVVVQPGEGPSYWQPVPANGHADPVLFPGRTGFDGVSMGFQTVAPGGFAPYTLTVRNPGTSSVTYNLAVTGISQAWVTLPASVTQKFIPSLHAPVGAVLAPVEIEPRGLRSAALKSDTLLPAELVTNMRSPSKAMVSGPAKPPVNVAKTNGVLSGLPDVSLTRTTVTELPLALGTQILMPSKTGCLGLAPTGIV